jgi:tetratricopeptide (TPR) repeat protein
MLKNFTKILFKNFALFLFFIAFQIPLSSFAQSSVSNVDVIQEIEKSLLFDKESREKMDFFQKKKSGKSDIVINQAGSLGQDEKSAVEITIVDPKSENFNIREKEKLAYNATLIGQYEVAIELYKQVIALEPTNLYSKFSLAVVYQQIGQYRQAKSLYYELLKTNPANEEEIVGNLLSILVEESPKDAVYLLSRLTTENPKSAYILAQAAIAYDKVKNYDQAISLFQRAISLDEDNLGYKYNLAIIYDKTSDREKALELYSSVAKNYSGEDQSIPIDQVQKRIESIRSKL